MVWLEILSWFWLSLVGCRYSGQWFSLATAPRLLVKFVQLSICPNDDITLGFFPETIRPSSLTSDVYEGFSPISPTFCWPRCFQKKHGDSTQIWPLRAFMSDFMWCFFGLRESQSSLPTWKTSQIEESPSNVIFLGEWTTLWFCDWVASSSQRDSQCNIWSQWILGWVEWSWFSWPHNPFSQMGVEPKIMGLNPPNHPF